MSSPSAIACREIFDENSQPSAEEISEYAQQLGIDPESESHLLPLARDGLMQALPAPWKAYYDEKLQTHYYYNEESKKTQWEHPLDNVYRELVKKVRDSSVQDDTCASVQELLTSEENTKNLERVETKVESDEELSTDSENHPSDVKDNASTTLMPGRRLTPLGRPPLSPLTRIGDMRISPLRRSTENPLSNKPLLRNSSDRDLLHRPSLERPKMLFKQQSEIIDLKMHVLNNLEDDNFSSLLSGAKVEKGFSLSGKNTFFKISKSDLPSPDTDKSLPLDSTSMTKSDPPKGILREKMTDATYRRPDFMAFGRPKTASFEEDRKSVRFKLENLPEPTISPGSNSSSEQNDNQSSIISAAPTPPIQPLTNVTSPHNVTSPRNTTLSSHNTTSSSHNTSPHNVTSQHNLTPLQNIMSSHNLASPHNTTTSSHNTTSPQNITSPHNTTSSHNTTSPHNIISPHNTTSSHNTTSPHNMASPHNTASAHNTTSPHNTTSSHNTSPHNLASLHNNTTSSHNTTSPQNTTSPHNLTSPHNTTSSHNTSLHNTTSPHKMASQSVPLSGIVLSPLAGRPPLPPRIESPRDSIESESHTRSPRRRIIRPPAADYIKPDLFQKNFQKIADLVRPGDIEPTTHLEEPSFGEKEARPRSPMIPQKSKISINLMESIESETSIDSPDREFANLDLNDLDDSNDKPNENTQKDTQNLEENEVKTELKPIPQIKVPNLELSKTDTEVSKSEDSKLSKTIDPPKSPQIKISPLPDRSPKFEFNRNWNPLSTYKPLNKAIIAPQVKTDPKNLTSPRLDGVIISQGKTNSDNVVVVYQFETQEDTPKVIKSPLIPDMIERNKADERKRLELSLQKELEGIRVEWVAKERKMRAELQEELKELEEKFLNDKKVRLSEQAERHQREMEEALETAEKKHQAALELAVIELEDKYRRETEIAEVKHAENIQKLNEQYKARLVEQQNELEIENERELQELQVQLQATLIKERSVIVEENKAILKSLREDHAARISEMKQDYRAEVERLRTQHLCHVSEVRARLAASRAPVDHATRDKYKALKEKYARLKHDVKMSIERRNKRREMSMTTGSETEKSNSHKANPSLERCKELNETSVSVTIEPIPTNKISNPTIKCNDNETSYSESNAQKSIDNNNDEWKLRRDNPVHSADTSQTSGSKPAPAHRPRRTAVAFKDPPTSKRKHDRDRSYKDRDKYQDGATTDFQDSSDATTADEKPKESLNGPGRRRCFTRLKSASTSRLNYSPKRSEGWSSPLECLRQQLRKLDDLEDQFPDLACQPAYSLRYPFTELGTVAAADTAELEFVRHRALVEREGMRRARQALQTRRAALRDNNRPPNEDREATELEVALHRARALLGEKEIRLRHIERSLRRLAPPRPQHQETSSASSNSSGCEGGAETNAGAGGAVLRSLRALHADVRDIWRALDARRPHTASPETSSYNAATTSQTRMTLSAPDPMIIHDNSDGGVSERARGLRAWLQTTP